MHKMLKESSKRSSVVLPCLLGLTVVYQMAFQFILWQKVLPAADELESPVLCWGAQKEQQGKHKAHAGQCEEVELFESWQTSNIDETLQREEDPEWFASDIISVDPKGHIQLRELENHGFGVGTSQPLHPITTVPDSPKSAADEQTRHVEITDFGKPHAHADAYKAVPAAVPKSKIFDQVTDEFQGNLENLGFHAGGLKAAGFDSIQANQSEVAKYEVPQTERNLVHLGFHLDHMKAAGFQVHYPGGTSAQWSTDIQALQKRLAGSMQHLKDLHHHTLSELQTSRESGNATHKPELLDKIEALQRELCADHSRQGHPECAQLLSSEGKVDAIRGSPNQVFLMGQLGSVTHRRIKWSPPNTTKPAAHPMMKSSEWIASLSAAQARLESRYRKMRRGRGTMKERKQTIRNWKDAKAMQMHLDKLKTGLANIEQHRAVWESALEARTLAIGIQMCSEEWRRGNPACKHFLHPSNNYSASESTKATASEVANAPFLTLPILAPSGRPTNRKFLEKHVDQKRLVLTAKDLRGKHHWVGRIPKVACIMSVPTVNDTSKETWLRFAMTNAVNAFRSQKYEGPKQLVIVHNNQDKMAWRIAHHLADGVYVKPVAAHLPVPSTMSMRYGAWSADKDADVVVRWDMNAYHHPERLAMQVRALGSSGRPVSAAMWGVTFSGNGKRSVAGEESGLENSMVGIRSWMDLHWHPHVENFSGPLAKLGDLVLVDMPELTQATNKR